jgi:hypothetical protein
MDNKQIQESIKAEAIENLNLIKEKVVLKVLNDLEIGKLFYLNNAKGLYMVLGYKNLRDFVYSLNLDYKKIERLVIVYNKYIVKAGFKIEQLKKMTVDRMYLFVRYMDLINNDTSKERFLKLIDPRSQKIVMADIKYALSKNVEFKDYDDMEKKLVKINRGELLIRNRKIGKPDEIKNLREFLVLLKSETFPTKMASSAKIKIKEARKAVEYMIKVIER